MNNTRRLATAFAASLIMSAAHTFATPLVVAPEQLHDLRNQRANLDATVKKLNESNKLIEVALADNSAAKGTIKLHEAASKKARVKLEELQAFDRNNPGELAPDRLRTAEEENRSAIRALKDMEDKRAASESRINELGASATHQYADFKRMQKIYEGDVGREVERHLQERVRALQVSKIIEASAQVSCGDESVAVCRERSKKAAELKASEQGSVVLVNSLTEIKNFKLTKEELRSEVRATLSDEKILAQNFIGDSGFETKISVRVEPAISESLREQMATTIRAEIYTLAGGRIDYALVQNPTAPDSRVDVAVTASKNIPAHTDAEDAGKGSSAPMSGVFRNQLLLIRAKSLSVKPVSYGQNVSTSDFTIATSVEIENVSKEDIWVGVTSLRVGACEINGFNDFAGVTFVHGDESYADFKQIKNGSSEDRRNTLTMLPAGSKTVLLAQSNTCGINGMVSLAGKSAPFSVVLVLDNKRKYQRLSAAIAEFPTSPNTHRAP